MQKLFMVVAGSSCLLANMLGAFGAHAMKNKITPAMLEVFKTGVHYQFTHSLALFMLGILLLNVTNQWLSLAGIAFIIGIILFSGSLYVLSITGIKALGMITPVGGLAFIAGWALMIIGVLKVNFV